MSKLVISQEAKVYIYNQLSANPFFTSLDLRLFKNDYLPNPSSLFADFVESDFAGYVVYSLAGPGGAVIRADGTPVCINSGFLNPCFFTGPPSQICYGIFICQSGTNDVRYSCRFDEPINWTEVNGQIYPIANLVPDLLDFVVDALGQF
jgi:hypothetical protein